MIADVLMGSYTDVSMLTGFCLIDGFLMSDWT